MYIYVYYINGKSYVEIRRSTSFSTILIRNIGYEVRYIFSKVLFVWSKSIIVNRYFAELACS